MKTKKIATATVKPTLSRVGAWVRYCGHEGVFIADVYAVGNTAVIRANGRVGADNLFRDPQHLAAATHHIMDYPTNKGLFWKPEIGVFVVPKANVKVLR